MASITKQLVVKVTSNNTWTQLTEGAGGSAYTVPTSGSNPRTDVKLIRGINFSSGSATMYFAFATSSPTLIEQEVWPRPQIPPSGMFNDDSIQIVRAGEKLWAKVVDTSGSPTAVFRVSALEVF